MSLADRFIPDRLKNFRPRDSGGGFKGSFDVDDPITKTAKRDDRGRFELPDGTYLADTRYHYVVVVRDGEDPQPCVLSLSSTQIKKSRTWMSQMRALKARAADGREFCPPTYGCLYRLTTVPESNDFGSWRGVRPDFVRLLGDDEASLYKAAKDFAGMVRSGNAKVDEAAMAASDSDGDGDGDEY